MSVRPRAASTAISARPGSMPSSSATGGASAAASTAMVRGGGIGRPSGSKILWIALAVLALGMLLTTMHRIGPEERGVVTLFGRYNSTLQPGISFTLPGADRAGAEGQCRADPRNLARLGGGRDADADRRPEHHRHRLSGALEHPRSRAISCSSCARPTTPSDRSPKARCAQVVAQVSLQDAIGNRRGEIEARVQEEMQSTLDRYQSGVSIHGVAIQQADPPGAVNDAFKEVTAAQQDAESARQQGQCLCAPAAPAGAGRSDRVRQGLRSVSNCRPK